MKSVDPRVLSELIQTAGESPRKRSHYRLHPTLDDPIQRMAMVMNIGTYVRPHRHIEPSRWELFAILQGQVVVLCFTDDGTVINRVELKAGGPIMVTEIEAGHWHSITSLEDNSLLLECKPGPYIEIDDKDFASWSPQEGNRNCSKFTEWFTQCHPGDAPPKRFLQA